MIGPVTWESDMSENSDVGLRRRELRGLLSSRFSTRSASSATWSCRSRSTRRPTDPWPTALAIDLGAAVAVRAAAQRDGAAGIQAPADPGDPGRRRAEHVRAGQQPGADPAVLAMAAPRRRGLGRSERGRPRAAVWRVRLRLGARPAHDVRDQPLRSLRPAPDVARVPRDSRRPRCGSSRRSSTASSAIRSTSAGSSRSGARRR